MVRLTEIREAIDDNRELSDYEARRMALGAVSKISDPAKAAEMCEQFHAALVAIDFAPALGVGAMEDARSIACDVLERIEAASRPN